MGWLNWIERFRVRRRARDRSPGFFDARGPDVLSTVGASYCTAEIDLVTGGGTGVFDLEVFLVRDPRNTTDPHAIVVQSRDARRLAYLDRPQAYAYAPAFDLLGADALARATVSRSGTEHPWVITLHVDRRLLEELRDEAVGPRPGDPRTPSGGAPLQPRGRELKADAAPDDASPATGDDPAEDDRAANRADDTGDDARRRA